MRADLDEVDAQLVPLLEQRVRLSAEARAVKDAMGLPRHDAAREDLIASKATGVAAVALRAVVVACRTGA